MTEDERHTKSIRNERPANDNGPAGGADTDSNRPRPARRQARLAVRCDWPYRLPVLTAEVELIEAYLSDVIREIIANDNEPQ